MARTVPQIKALISDLGKAAHDLAEDPTKTTSQKAGGMRRIQSQIGVLSAELRDAKSLDEARMRYGGDMHAFSDLSTLTKAAPGLTASTTRLAPAQKVADWIRVKGMGGPTSYGPTSYGPEPELSFDRWFKGIATGNWRGAEVELKAQSEGTPSAGGYLVPTPLAAQVIDLARNVGRVFAAGATTVPMDSQTLKMARQTGDPALAWHSEAATINPSSLTFDAITFTAQTLPVLIKVSLELLEDAGNTDRVISHAVGEAIALELDRVALRGSGTPPEPKGIRNTSGITVQSMGTNGAQPTDYGFLATAIENVRTANFEPNAVIYSPRTAGRLSRLSDSTGQPLRAPDDVANLTKFATNQVPNNLTQGTATTASDAYVGQWDQLLIGIRTHFSLRPLNEKFVDTGEVGFFGYLRADVQLAHPAAFNVVQGIL